MLYSTIYGTKRGRWQFCQQPPSSDLNLTHTHSVTRAISHTAPPCDITRTLIHRHHIHNVHKHVQGLVHYCRHYKKAVMTVTLNTL